MSLLEKLDKALANRNLSPIASAPCQSYATIAEGLLALRDVVDEDGVGSFIARELGIDEIRLPMAVDGCIVEDIQRTKAGNFQVHFRRSEPA